MKAALLIISACLIILLLPATLVAINSFRAAEYTDTFNNTTGAEQISANLTLSQELFNDDSINLTISSNRTADAPYPNSYASATRILNVTGLVASSTRTFIVEYKVGALGDYYGADIATKTWPLFLVIGVIGLIAGAVYNATKHGE